MKGITKRERPQILRQSSVQVKRQVISRIWLFVLLGILSSSSTGRPLESSLGWVAYPPTMISLETKEKKSKQRPANRLSDRHHVQLKEGWRYGCRSWKLPVTRSLMLLLLWQLSGGESGGWTVWLPWLEWGMGVLSNSFPWLGQQIEIRAIRWGLSWLRLGSIWALGGLVVWQHMPRIAFTEKNLWYSGLNLPLMGCVKGQNTALPGQQDKAAVSVVQEDGQYRIKIEGPLSMTLPVGRSFQLRMVILFLRQLESETARYSSRATRNGRRPFVSQQRLAAWFDIKQPEISRWEKYLLDENWADLLSLNSPLILTWELRRQIVDVLARFPWWSIEKATAHLQEQGVEVTYSQVQQTAQDVGWQRFKQTMCRFFVLSAESIRPREEGLVSELLMQVEVLIEKVGSDAVLTPEQRIEISQLQVAASELGLTPSLPPKAVPWAQKVKWVLFAAETESGDGSVCCAYCASSQVRRKSKKPRSKRYKDEHGEWQSVEVYRYYCDNEGCPYGSFTHFPRGLLPHSPYPLEMRLAAIQLYAWGGVTYRRTAASLGIKSGQAYRWVTAFGQELLPMAALFGVIRSSGVVGVDEKWVQVPDKAARGHGSSPRGTAKRWMYVYLAVDVYTYDLLHIAIYAHNTKPAARTFLLALKAKGYSPHVIVTDLRVDYGSVVAETFPQATHHECIFHALQWWSKQFKEVYGNDYAKTQPLALQLKKDIQHIFQAKTKRTAQKRYEEVVALRTEYVQRTPDASTIFDSLERHWPKLVNSIESVIIPSTNNATEMVIGRFDVLYKNFCGFDSLESARVFLAVFEKVYRFTPFSDDAQPRIRGKSPLEVAGYDISNLSMTAVCRGWALNLPLDFALEGVPNM